MKNEPPKVLVVGAGPTGLVLSLWLTHLGIRVRVIDKSEGPGTTSRALGVQARTLEEYNQLGLADTVVKNGLKFKAANFWVTGKKKGKVAFGDAGLGLSPFPYMMIYPQDEHERFLVKQLLEAGVEVERSTTLVNYEDYENQVSATLQKSDGTQEIYELAYIAGCDGAHSSVREGMGVGFPGGTYTHTFYVADVEAKGPVMDKELHISLDTSDFLAVFPLKGEDRARLVGTVRLNEADQQREATWKDVSKNILDRMRISVNKVNWFSTYHVHHRVAHHFRKGRAFILGDAAHIHSPVGAQGMNTGIGDAVNLAWKLAAVLRGYGDSRLLDTYERERIGFARRLVATTDRLFTFISHEGLIARVIRLHIIPYVIPVAFTRHFFRRFLFRTVSQIGITYRSCDLNEGSAGGVRGGDRLPWASFKNDAGKQGSNFDALATFDWQVHVYGNPSNDLKKLCEQRRLVLHVYSWQIEMQHAGLMKNALYLIRPDGYVAFADSTVNVAKLQAYLNKWSIIGSGNG